MTDKYAPTEDWLEKEWLYERYWGEMKSTHEIADEAGVNPRSIDYRMKELGIPTRSRRDACKLGRGLIEGRDVLSRPSPDSRPSVTAGQPWPSNARSDE